MREMHYTSTTNCRSDVAVKTFSRKITLPSQVSPAPGQTRAIFMFNQLIAKSKQQSNVFLQTLINV